MITPRATRFGWRPDTPDQRDRLSVRKPLASLPTKVDLRESGAMPAVWDQGQLGSCTAHAIGSIFAYDLAKQGKPSIMPSRLFIYYGERVIENTVDSDAGAEIRDGMKVLAHDGVPDETLWPYDVARFATKPPQSAYDAAAKDRCITYTRQSGSLRSIQEALARGFPVACGFSVYESFESDKAASTGIVPNPKKTERLLGGHAVAIVGYTKRSATTADLIWRNSWGAGWGDGGYFHTSSAFLRACGASDFWTCEVTS